MEQSKLTLPLPLQGNKNENKGGVKEEWQGVAFGELKRTESTGINT